MTHIKTAVILIGEYNPLIEVCGEAVITRQILRCKSIGIEKVFVFGHLTPETLDHLRLYHSSGKIKAIFEFEENPWATVLAEKEGADILVLSCEHFTDIHLLSKTVSEKTEANEVLMFGETDPNEISTVRPRILLTKTGQPIDLLDRAKSDAVWMGIAIINEEILKQLAHRKGDISPITLKQASMITQYGKTRLISIKAMFWDRIDASRIGANLSQEVLFHSDKDRFVLNIWESGISNFITSIFNYSRAAIVPLYFLLIPFCFIGGWCLSTLDPLTGLIGLSLTLLGQLFGRSIQEISEMHLISKYKMLGSLILSSRLSALGIFCGLIYSDRGALTFSFDKKMLTLLAITLLIIVTLVEATKYTVFHQLEQAPIKYSNGKNWQKYLLEFLNLHWVWYLYPIFFAFNLFQSYFSLFIIEIYFFYLIFLLQLPQPKVPTKPMNEIV